VIFFLPFSQGKQISSSTQTCMFPGWSQGASSWPASPDFSWLSWCLPNLDHFLATFLSVAISKDHFSL
jgi:hypothetical protein